MRSRGVLPKRCCTEPPLRAARPTKLPPTMRTRAKRHLCAVVSAAAALSILGVVDCEVSNSYPGATTRSALHDDADMDPTKQDRARRPAVHDSNFGHTHHANDKVSGIVMQGAAGAAERNRTATRPKEVKDETLTLLLHMHFILKRKCENWLSLSRSSRPGHDPLLHMQSYSRENAKTGSLPRAFATTI